MTSLLIVSLAILGLFKNIIILNFCPILEISFIFLFWQLTGLTDSDKEALVYVVKAAVVMDEIFNLQVMFTI